MTSWELPYCSCEHLCKDSLAQPHSFSLLGLKTDDLVVDFLVEDDSVNVVKQTEQMSLRDRKRRDHKKNQLQGEKEGRNQRSRTDISPVWCASPRLGPGSPAERGQTRRKNEGTPDASSPGNPTETSDRAPAAPAGGGGSGAGEKTLVRSARDAGHLVCHGSTWPSVSSPTQHCTTLGISCARCMILCHALSMFWNRLASYTSSRQRFKFPTWSTPRLRPKNGGHVT